MCYSCMVTRYSQDCGKVVTSIQLCWDSFVTIYWTDYQSTVHTHKYELDIIYDLIYCIIENVAIAGSMATDHTQGSYPVLCMYQ